MELRVITDAEVTAFRETLLNTFGNDLDGDPDGDARFRALIAPGQAWGAFDGATMVGTTATFALQLGVPGGASLPTAGLTMVSVRPSHRRRGIVRSLMDLHLADARERGYPASALWASEAAIYGRFGYGISAYSDAMRIEKAGSIEVAEGRALDALEWIDEKRAREVLPTIYEQATAMRPGALRRSALWWSERRFLEAPYMRAGASRRRHVLARRGDQLVGYVVYRQRGGFHDDLPSGKTEINELIAIDPQAEATLWRFVLGIDLHPSVTWWNTPTDDTLSWLVTDPRKIYRHRVDTLWLRIEDVPGALAARRYPVDGALRFAIDDAAWELTVENGHGRCVATTKNPELRFARTTLGALYLGATTATQLARADLVRGDAAAISRADGLFASPVAAWCPEIF